MLLLLCSLLIANIGPKGFIDYPNDYFVETGTHHGAGIHKALQAGFREIRSIDHDPVLVEKARLQFAYNLHIKITLGDSAKDLWAIIKDIRSSITFWLDAHNIYPLYGAKNCPLLEELDQIKKHPIKTHTILIDDMHCLNTLYFDYLTKKQLLQKICEINPGYTVTYITGGDTGAHPQNIMVARVLGR